MPHHKGIRLWGFQGAAVVAPRHPQGHPATQKEPDILGSFCAQNNKKNMLPERKKCAIIKLTKRLMRRVIYEWKSHILIGFGDFLKLGLGKPEQLEGYRQIRYSLHVAANARLIIEPNATQDTIMICTAIEVEGVSDYHGSKENWYIS